MALTVKEIKQQISALVVSYVGGVSSFKIKGVLTNIADRLDDEPNQVTVTGTSNFTTETLSDLKYSQNGKNVLVKNGATAITITVGATDNFIATYLKVGTGAITFLASAGKTIVKVTGTEILNGVAGSTASVSVDGNTIYLNVSNAA
jgi:hypothetical protein